MELPTIPDSTDALLSDGSSIGPYLLLQQIGEGGMGDVWEAEQREPLRRRVALKLLKLGLDTKAFLARFDVERQALAFMDHPNIARVLDAGATAGGRPYYVMELVAGLPINEYCDAHHLTNRERLALFGAVCRAVQHAHQKGVIHRDLKPSNVLVTELDNVPVPKVIDFGIAKALGGHFTDVTLVTELGRPLGTPAYMSPEQWEAGRVDIDTRSDIYSLGVMLYELLAGSLPTEPDRVMRAGPAAAQLLRDSSPPAPSTKVRSLGDASGAVTRARNTDLHSLARELKGDLDWIVLKAMDPDRSRRYETAHALAQDIGRHLNSEPVQARPPSVGYRLGRFVRRNRLAAATATAAVVAAVAFTTITVQQARRLGVERDRARQEAARANSLNDFLQKTLLSPDPIDGLGRNVTMLTALDSASARLASERPIPAVAASIEGAIGWAYFKLGEYDRAEPLLRRSLDFARREPGPDSVTLAQALVRVGAVHDVRARVDSAAQLYSEAVRLLRKQGVVGESNLAATLIRVGEFFRVRQDTAAARAALIEARHIFERAADSIGLATADDNLGALAYDAADYDSAVVLFRRALEVRRQRDENHPLVASALQNLAAALEKIRQPVAAESAYRDALRIATQTLGEEHDLVAAVSGNLGQLLADRGSAAEAESFLRRALTLDERALGRDHPFAAVDAVNLAHVLCRVGKAAEGEALSRRASGILDRHEGRDAWQSGVARTAIGTCLTAQRRFDEAERELRSGLRIISDKLGRSHWRADTAKVRLRALYVAWGKQAQADSLSR